MRLNSRTEIMVYLGRSVKNRVGWRKARREYAAALHYLSGGNRVWASSEELDALDRARGLTVAEALELKRGAVRGGGGSMPPEFQKLVKELYGDAMAKQGKGT